VLNQISACYCFAGCADTLDIGETAHAMVLADDISGTGKMDLLVATINGNIYCIATAAKYHPLKSWPTQVLGSNGFVARWNWEGIYATAGTRIPRDVRGLHLPVRFTILDKRPGSNSTKVSYSITVTLQVSGMHCNILKI
jgi:hypothetical protein